MSEKTKETGKRPPRVGRLDTVGGVVAELGKIYRAARRGDIDTQDVTRLAYVLSQIRAAIESSEIERRLDELERKAGTL